MAESHVVTALVSKRAEMAGLIEHHQKEMGRLADDLAHLDATLKLFSPEIDLRTIRAKEHRTRNRFFRPGECQRMVLDIFREAQGAALSSRQIGEALAARRGLESDHGHDRADAEERHWRRASPGAYRHPDPCGP
jgi:hypothetical protein